MKNETISNETNIQTVKRKVQAKPAAHQPQYNDADHVANVVKELETTSGIVNYSQIVTVRQQLKEIALGNGMLLQSGPCVQNVHDTIQDILRTNAMMEQCANAITEITGQNVLTVGRHFNNSKPRTSNIEIIEGVEMETYKGSNINHSTPTAKDRTPDAGLMAVMHAKARYMTQMVPEIGLHSHEALLLPYELSQLRESEDGKVYSAGAHMLWVGHRTNDLDGAHMELASSVENGVGVKIGPDVKPEELKAVLDKLDPNNEPGKVTLIFRMGAENIYRSLPRLADAVKESGHTPIMMTDPMHGNGKSKKGKKTRYTGDIIAEMNAFSRILTDKKMHVGGIMLEAVGNMVTECVGHGVKEKDLKGQDYQTACDPCLNPHQSVAVIRETMDVLTKVKKIPDGQSDIKVQNLAWAI